MVDQTSGPRSIGAGQQTPTDGNSEFTKIAFLVRQMIARLDVMKLVKVVAVSGGGGAIAAAGTVDVQLLVSQIDGAGNAVPQGVVHGIPWWRLQGGTSAIVCDPAVGDVGFVVCADRDVSNVKAAVAGGKDPVVTPGSLRKYSVSDGIYVGGCLNGAPTQYLAFTATGIKIADRNGTVLETTAGGFVLTGNLAVNGSITATGEIVRGLGTADPVTLGLHLHTSGGAGSPTTPPTPGT